MARTKKKKPWSREEILQRLMRIADEARDATFTEKTDKEGAVTREYDVKCASIELKAVEFTVKLSGFEDEEKDRELLVTMSEEAGRYAV